MKTRFLFSVILCILLFECDSNDDANQEFFTFKTNSQIVLTEIIEDQYLANIDVGDNLVFIYEFVEDDEPDISDDEYTERIIFEIDPELSSFNITDVSLAQLNMYFNRFCFCPNIASIQVLSGTAKGSKINSEKWKITLDITFEIDNNLVERQIEGVFRID